MSDTEAPDVTAPRLTRRGRVRKWDRAPQPHDWRWYVGNIGKTLITTGLLMFAFVGYQLYGTGIETAAAQKQLEDEFEERLAQFDSAAPVVDDVEEQDDMEEQDDVDEDDDGENVDSEVVDGAAADPVVVPDPPSPEVEPEAPPTTESTSEPVDDVVPVEQQNIPDVADGDALARLEIPAIGVNDIVVAGVDTSDLKKGPGHFADTPLPGQLGNTAIAGHRTTFGQPFRNIDRLAVGDEVHITTPNGVFVYLVTGQQIVSPADYQVIATSDPTIATITLVSCHPVFTARERIIISGELDPSRSSAVGAPVVNYGRETEPSTPEDLPGEDLPREDIAADEPAEAAPVTAVDQTDGAGPVTTDDAAVAVGQTDEPTDQPTGDEPVPDAPADDPAPANDIDQLGSEQVNASIADAFSEGWFSDPAANPQVGLWGLVLAAIAIAAYAISRRFRRDLLGLAVGVVPFAVALYFFFQNVNRLLPPNL